ncbi:MAG: S9 family peptidase [Bacteroidales bacterium]|nr:S9 family peptidase [Bacteroidales bacterium]
MSAALLLFLGVLLTFPAGDGGKTLTVEQAVASREVYPDLKPFYWHSDGTLAETSQPHRKYHWKLPESKGDISYGDIVSRREFGIESGIFPSPDSTLLAVYRKDESLVSDFPLPDISSRTGGVNYIKYPMAGMDSERIGVCICDTLGHIRAELRVDDFGDDRYITNLSWSPDGKYILAQVLDRSQHRCRLNMYRSSDGGFVRTILSEENDKWVEPLDPVYFVKGSYEFIYRTDNRDNYRSLYLCDTLGHIRRLTNVDADVEYAGNDGKWLYYYSAEVSPVENHLFRMRIKGGKATRLTPEKGWHKAYFSPGFDSFIDRYSNLETPGLCNLRKADGSLVKELARASNPLKDFVQCKTSLGNVKSADGRFENYYRLTLPPDFTPEKKYPLLVYVYGGPHSQMVQERWMAGMSMWELMMAQKGYVVYTLDGRGTSRRGAEYEKAINRCLGRAEMADQMAGISELMNNPWIDRERVGIHGWSYGGFMTISLMSNYPDVFKAGVAGGPVIDWKWYEVMYGERYMDTPESNPRGYAETSLIGNSKKLKGKLLVCQGAADDIVVWQHSMNFIQACIERQIQIDFFPYPLSGHNMYGKTRVHLYNKITDYFERNLR